MIDLCFMSQLSHHSASHRKHCQHFIRDPHPPLSSISSVSIFALTPLITWQLYASFRHRCNLSVLLRSWSYYGPQLFTCPCSFSCFTTPFLFSCFVEHSVVLGNIQNNYIQISNRWMCELYYGHQLFTCPFCFSCFPTPFLFSCFVEHSDTNKHRIQRYKHGK